jgi:hypothetical protein
MLDSHFQTINVLWHVNIKSNNPTNTVIIMAEIDNTINDFVDWQKKIT